MDRKWFGVWSWVCDGVRVCLFLAVIYSTKRFDMANQAFKSNNYTLAIQHTNGISSVSFGNTSSNVGYSINAMLHCRRVPVIKF